MLNHTQTRPKFQYIFTALERNNLAAGSVRVSVEAETLHEAKAKLKAQYTATFYQERQSVEAGPTKCTWRFLALHRSDRSAAPCRLSVEAFTEKEARQVLSAHFILSLAARLPVSEVRHA
ncbi:host cell division inhibitor Icd-like protein [Yersinia enterocolitica]